MTTTVTLGDVQNSLPGFQIGPATKPNTLQVSRFIVDTEAEVRSRLAACGVQWPAEDSDVHRTLRNTVIDGVVWRTLRAQYSGLASAAIPQELTIAGEAYQAGLKAIPTLAKGMIVIEPAASVGGVPLYDRDRAAPRPGETFGSWTARRDRGRGWGAW